jgi:hypothetical protein
MFDIKEYVNSLNVPEKKETEKHGERFGADTKYTPKVALALVEAARSTQTTYRGGLTSHSA